HTVIRRAAIRLGKPVGGRVILNDGRLCAVDVDFFNAVTEGRREVARVNHPTGVVCKACLAAIFFADLRLRQCRQVDGQDRQRLVGLPQHIAPAPRGQCAGDSVGRRGQRNFTLDWWFGSGGGEGGRQR